MKTRAVDPLTATRHPSPHTTKRARVRKLQPLARHVDTQPRARPHTNVLSHLKTETDRLKTLMAVAIATRDLKQVEAIMAQLLTLVERSDAHESRETSDDEQRFDDQLIAYLELCEADLQALVRQEERERTHQRFAANALMRRAVGLLHTGTSVDEAAVHSLLDQAEGAYRRARDKRADCIPAIRYRVSAEARLAEATVLFDAGGIGAAIATAQSARDQYAAFRTSPVYQRSQLLLSLSSTTTADAWDEPLLRNVLSHARDDLDRCFADVEHFFHEKARAQTTSLVVESKRLADAQRFVEARDVMRRCDAVYTWLAEPLPPAVAKWKRQLTRLVVGHELHVLEDGQRDRDGRRDVAAQLRKWTRDRDAGVVTRVDLVECGVAGFALQCVSVLGLPTTEDLLTHEVADAALQLLDGLVQFGTTDDSVAHASLRQVADTKTVVLALLRLAEWLDVRTDRVRVLDALSTLLDTKQSAHVAIHKCAMLPTWSRLRDANVAEPTVLVALLHTLHQLLLVSFPGLARVWSDANVVRAVVSTVARHYKHIDVARSCVDIVATLCRSRDHCVAILAPSTSGLSDTLVHALRHYAQQPPTNPTKALVAQLRSVVQTLCALDPAVAKAMDAATIPALLTSLAQTAAWQLPADTVAVVAPQKLNVRIGNGGTGQSPSLAPMDAPPQPVQHICFARFGTSLQIARRRQFVVVRFLVPDASTSGARADQCRLEVTRVDSRPQTHTQRYGFPSNGLYSLGLLRRELGQATATRGAFFRTLVASLQPVR